MDAGAEAGVVRIGLLGTARIAERALLEAAQGVPEVTVAAVAGRDSSRAQAYAERTGIPVAYGSYNELLADPDIDAIYNPLPNSLHGPWTLAAIAAGKHVLCEKPFASNAAEAQQVADAAAASGLVVMEAMHYRYHPLIRRLREVVRTLGAVRYIQCWTSFAIGDPANIRYDYALGGGALMDGGCYAIDAIRMIASESGEPTVAAAVADTEPGGLVDRATAARLTFPDGATAWFESAFTRQGEARSDLHVVCDQGAVWFQNFIVAHQGRLRGDAGLDEDAGNGSDTTYTWQLRAFAEAIRTGSTPETSTANAVATMRLIDDAYRAAGLPPR
jgi:predicted dehydrogenase